MVELLLAAVLAALASPTRAPAAEAAATPRGPAPADAVATGGGPGAAAPRAATDSAAVRPALPDAAAPDPATAPAPDPATDPAADVPEDLQDVAAELDRLDQPLPVELLLTAPAAAPAIGARHGQPPANVAGGRGVPPFTGQVRWRLAAGPAGARLDGRGACAAGPLDARWAARREPDAAPTFGGGLRLSAGRWRLLAGQVVLRHGLGLTAADPGRRVSLGADRPLAAPAGGLALRASATAGPGAARLGLETGAGPFRLALRGGAGAGADAATGPSAGGAAAADAANRPGRTAPWEIRLAFQDAAPARRVSTALLVARDTTGTAFSWAGRCGRGDTGLTWEAARLPTAAGSGSTVGLTGVTWQPRPAWRLELQAGLATRPVTRAAAALPAAARAGWAVRAAWRARGRETLDLLLQGARLEPATSTPRRRALRVLEIAWARQLGGGVGAGARLRRTERPETSWSDQAPWEPGRTGPAGSRTALAATLDWNGAAASLAAQWRLFQAGPTAAGATGGTRQLAAVGGRAHLGARIEAWFDAALAWGDDVDLVRAAQPLPGVVVARHWGDWASEVVAGGRLDAGPVSLRAGVARRLPRRGPEGAADGFPAAPPAVVEGWVEAGASW